MAEALPPAGHLIPPAALALVPGAAQGPPLRIEPLRGGSVNEVWRVDTAEGRFVLRLDGPDWRRPGVERWRELQLHSVAAAAGLAPRIIAKSAALDAWVCEFLPGRCWTPQDYADPAQLQRLGERLAQLHRLPPPAVASFDPVSIAHGYIGGREPPDTDTTRRVLRLLRKIQRADAALAAERQPGVIVHGDPVHGNILDGERLWLLDWEYAQLADPVFDVAAVLAYYPAARAAQAVLLEAAQLSPRVAALEAAVIIHHALGELWLYARGEPLPPVAE